MLRSPQELHSKARKSSAYFYFETSVSEEFDINPKTLFPQYLRNTISFTFFFSKKVMKIFFTPTRNSMYYTKVCLLWLKKTLVILRCIFQDKAPVLQKKAWKTEFWVKFLKTYGKKFWQHRKTILDTLQALVYAFTKLEQFWASVAN